MLNIKEEQRVCIKFCVKNSVSGPEILRMLKTAFSEETLSKGVVYKWIKRFQNGRESIRDDPHPGQLAVLPDARMISEEINSEGASDAFCPVYFEEDPQEARKPSIQVERSVTINKGSEFESDVKEELEDEVDVKEGSVEVNESLDARSDLKDDLKEELNDSDVIVKEEIDVLVNEEEESRGEIKEELEDKDGDVSVKEEDEEGVTVPVGIVGDSEEDPEGRRMKVHVTPLTSYPGVRPVPQSAGSSGTFSNQYKILYLGVDPYACSYCPYRTSDRSDLVKHCRTHTADKPLECPSCSYKCMQKGALARHMRIHTDEKPFSCSRCTYRASHKSNLKKHLRLHSGVKPFTCPSCSYKSAHRNTLTRHLLTHTGEKPYSCSQCDYKATQKYNLVKHIKNNHEGETS